MERLKRSTRNVALASELVWRIKQLIIEEQWSPRQISGVLKKEGVSVSHQCIYNLIHADASGVLARHTRHKLKYRRRPKYKVFPQEAGCCYFTIPLSQLERISLIFRTLF